MRFVWVHADSFLRCVASPFHSFVTTTERAQAVSAAYVMIADFHRTRQVKSRLRVGGGDLLVHACTCNLPVMTHSLWQPLHCPTI